MSEVEEILNHDFLLRFVAIESIQHNVDINDTMQQNVENDIILTIMEIEVIDKEKNILSENTYELRFSGIFQYTFDIADDIDKNDYSSFDGDIILEKESRDNILKPKYKLYIQNLPDTLRIKIVFTNVRKKKISERRFIDGE